MQRAVFLPIINILIVCYSFHVVRAPINPSFTKPHQLEPKTTESIESIGNCEHHFKSSNIPTEDHEANAELSTHLKDNEDVLMENTDAAALEYLTSHPESDTILFWNNFSQEMSTILGSMDSENIIQSPDQTESRGMTTSTHFPFLEAQHTTVDEDSNVGSLKGNQFDSSASSSDPRMFQDSHNIKQQKQKPKLIGVQHKAHISKKKGKSKSRFQVLKNLPKIEEVEEELQYSHFQSRSVANLLKSKGMLALWHNYEVSRQIDVFFHNLDSIFYSILWSSSIIPCTPYHVKVAIHRVKKDVVIAFFGGLSLIRQRSQKDVPIKDLVSDGWVYLQDYLHQVFYPGQNKISTLSLLFNNDVDDLSSPSYLPRYMLNLDKYSPVQPSHIAALISNWTKYYIFEPTQCKIEFSTHSFLSEILSEAELRGKRILTPRLIKKKQKPSLPTLEFSISMLPHLSELELSKLKEYKGNRPANYLAVIGMSALTKHTDILTSTQIFFGCLERDMNQSLIEGIHSIGGPLRKDLIFDSKKIQDVIKAIKSFMVPAFLGVLVVLHYNQLTDQVMEILLKTGWEILQDYFSKWRNCFHEDPSSILLTKEEKLSHEVDWYHAKDTLHYFSQSRVKKNFPMDPVWFVLELWYETIIQKRDSWVHDKIEFEPSLPNQDVYHKFLACLKKYNS
ncbi:uncharacterized protein MELLADRAFT_67247 [Melampsora larici-populina 98AG31]|uniref:Secreted protein n=1 Tax=Melampsora larici-populina (strain 98AG31 / pathotype 3-4-7) TaxID=747676 RepID=F4S2C5_MELLP|nr:uncharacterized protein MELLADRAFT_67247 [Melampsora larici-populina 98AG31]EGG01150.1 hypothetical protein MELLADRAFT_67247 [Melampsora larici-populina 98AG31]